MRRWIALAAVIVLAAGCSDDEPGASSGAVASTAVAVTSTTIAATTTVVPTTVPSGCQDGPPPPLNQDDPTLWEAAMRGDCYHFWGVVEEVKLVPYEGGGVGCTGSFAYGTTPPMVDDVQSIYVGSNLTSSCRWLDTARPGDTVEVWTSLEPSVLGVGIWFEGIKVRDAK